MKNSYEVRGNVTAIIINSPKYGRHEALISTNKLKRAQEFTGSWRVVWKPPAKSFYVQGNTPKINGKRKAIHLHRLITNAPKGMKVDHINHDTLNNTGDNLRICTHAENQQNRKGADIDNKSSGIRGVTWNKKAKKWQSQIGINKNKIYLGCFDEIADAERAVKEARAKHMPYSVEAG